MKDCAMQFPTERARITSDNERVSLGRVIREKVTILRVLLDMPADCLVHFEILRSRIRE